MAKIESVINDAKFHIKYLGYLAVAWFIGFSLIGKKRRNGKRVAYLFSCPNHGNGGDIAIERAEVEMLKKNDYLVKKIEVYDFLKGLKHVASAISDSDLVCIQGGGSFGGLYPQADLERLVLFKFFKRNTIVSFPQTISAINEKIIKRYKTALKKRKNIYIFLREQKSYQYALSAFSFMKERIIMTPDIVLSLYRRSSRKNSLRTKITLSLRKDKEKDSARIDEDRLSRLLKKEYGDSINLLDTYVNLHGATSKKDEVLDALIKNYSESRIVITDRLHGMILAYITDTPCVAISNNNGKVKEEYDTWLKNSKKIVFVEDCSENSILKAVKNMINDGQNNANEALLPHFRKLEQLLSEK